MTLPIDTTEFWKDRITKAVNVHGDIHHSVYISRPTLWADIEMEHFAILRKEIDDNMRVLDAGCGYGRCASLFSNYTGVDFSPDFLLIAHKDYPHKQFFQCDLKTLPFKDKSFDVAFCISIAAMVKGNLGPETWEVMLHELMRVANKVLILEYEEPKMYDIY